MQDLLTSQRHRPQLNPMRSQHGFITRPSSKVCSRCCGYTRHLRLCVREIQLSGHMPAAKTFGGMCTAQLKLAMTCTHRRYDVPGKLCRSVIHMYYTQVIWPKQLFLANWLCLGVLQRHHRSISRRCSCCSAMNPKHIQLLSVAQTDIDFNSSLLYNASLWVICCGIIYLQRAFEPWCTESGAGPP